MKLYNMNLSNFATKSRLVIYEKATRHRDGADSGRRAQLRRIRED